MTHFFIKRPEGRHLAVEAKTWDEAVAQVSRREAADPSPVPGRSAERPQRLHPTSTVRPSAPHGRGPQFQPSDNDRPLSGSAHAGETVNSRRAQVREELRRAMEDAARAGSDPAAAFAGEIGRNFGRLMPNWGSWIRGGTGRPDGNRLYGAVTDELGIPIPLALGFADAAEYIDDLLDRVGLGSRPDERFGADSPEARREIISGTGRRP